MNEDQVLKARPLSDLLSLQSMPTHLFVPSPESGRQTNQGSSIFDEVFYTSYFAAHGDNAISATIEMLAPGHFELAVVGLNSLAFGVGHEDFVPFTARVAWTNDNLAVAIDDIELNLRFSRELLLPAELDPTIPVTDPDYPRYKPKDDDTERAMLSATGSVYLDKDFDILVRGFDEFTLEPVKLPYLNSVYFTMEGLKLDLSRTSAIPKILDAGFDPDFQGLYVRKLTAVFQDDLEFLPDITANDFTIGTGGISGKITATFDLSYNANQNNFEGDATGELFGTAIGLRKFELELRANEVVHSEITGQLLLPFFDKPIEIEISLDLKGNISVGLKGTDGTVLAELTKEDILSMKINSFNFAKTQDEVAFTLGGSIKPLFGENIDWPEFGVNALKVSKELPAEPWDVNVEGGWIQFPESLSFTISRFQGWVSKVGFGTIGTETDGRERFIGFSGGIGFVSGFALAAEFDDLQLIYPTTSPIDISKIRLELKRARIGLMIPNAISLIGEVSKSADGFGGMIDVTIIPTEMRIMGGAEFGRTKPPDDEFSYMQIMMALELPPPGIPLGSTPLAIRGFEGKHAMNMGPSMDPGWEWAIAPPRGITPLSKMIPEKGGKMLGAGLKISSTDGTMVVINALLALILPGPVVLIEGRGGILTRASDQASPADPPFYALIVMDGKEKFFSANLSYNADLAKGIIKATGTLEMFFDFEQPSNWHIYMGQFEPKSKRIQATAFKVLKAQSYFELTAGPRIITGAYVGIAARKNFKVGHASIKIYIEGGVDLSWKPEHAAGFLAFLAEITVRVCGFGAGLNAHGWIDAKCPYPRHLHLEAAYRFSFNLPWPIPDVKIKGKIEKTWRDGQKYRCVFEPLVTEVLVDSEIPGIASKSLKRYGSETHPAKLADVPLVPLDARPTLSFAYPMNDDTPPSLALAGNAANGPILHKIGDDEYKFNLLDVRLEKLNLPEDPAGFNMTLNNPFDPANVEWETVEIPYGVWVADNSMTGHSAATNLRLFSNTPFTHFRQTMFNGCLRADYGLEFGSSSAGWLDSMSGVEAIFNANSFLQHVEAGATATAADLTARMQDQNPEYPLGRPEAEWRYLGFADVPVQLRTEHIDITNAVGLAAAPDAYDKIWPFDVIDLHFLPPDELLPDLHNIPTIVRGAFFEGALRIRFSIPVSECELYLYPVTRKSTAWGQYPEGWPDEGRPDNYRGDTDRPFPKDWCEKAQKLLRELAGLLENEKAKVYLQELIEAIDGCCRQQRPAKRPPEGKPSLQEFCEMVSTLSQKLAEVVKEEEGRAYLKELVGVIEVCCGEKPAEDTSDGELFPERCCKVLYALVNELALLISDKNARRRLMDRTAVIEKCCGKMPADKPGEDETLLTECCEKASALLGKLTAVVQEEKGRAYLKELVGVIQKCYKPEPTDEPGEDKHFRESCCEKICALLEKLNTMVEGEKAQAYFEKLVVLIEEHCQGNTTEESGEGKRWVVTGDEGIKETPDAGAFLSFEFAPDPKVLYQYPPKTSTWRSNDGHAHSVPHAETRTIVDNLYRITMAEEGKPFDEVEIENTLEDQGLFLIAIGYLPDVDESYNRGKDKIDVVVDSTWSGDGDAPVVLSPRSCYRLSVETEADCDDSAPQTHLYYFRTDGPPAKDIQHYIAWTVPGAQDYPLFRKYDVAIRFTTNYIDQFFNDLPLQLDLRSASGRVNSAQVEDGLSWRDERTHRLRPEERTYIDLLNASGVTTPINPEAIPGDKSLIMSGGQESVGVFEPDQAYTAVLTLPPESNFQPILATMLGMNYYFPQYFPFVGTADPDTDAVIVGEQPVIGLTEDFQVIKVAPDKDTSLFEFSFRTSKFVDFTEMFSHLVNGEANIRPITVTDPDALRTALNSLADLWEQVWRSTQQALWEKKLQAKQREETEEELLRMVDNKAKAGADLDQAFNLALTYLPNVGGMLLQPLPKETTVYFSPYCIIVELPEPVESARVSIANDAFDVLVACSSDETRWLIFPADSSDQFVQSGILAITYHLNIGDDHPRLGYGSLSEERVDISLGQ